MKRLVLILCLIILIADIDVFPQEDDVEDIIVPETGEEEVVKQKKTNVNIDARMLYGQYNTILWMGSIIQNFDNFTYQLNSNFKRSNDFGYRNTSFYENEIGFTSQADVTDKWKLLPEITVNNDSHDMYRNPIYSREEKDKVILTFKNEFTPMPTRWEFNFGGAYYTQRLDSALSGNVSSTNFYKANGEFGWEYIWSASNKLRFNSKLSHYFYRDGSDYDTFVCNEFLWNFKITEYLMINLGPLYDYNKDYGHFVSGKVNLSTASLKYVLVELTYLYQLYPFLPEEFYYQQKFMSPDYSLQPGKGHNAEMKIGIDVTKTRDRKFYVKKFEMKASGVFETNTDYYNYYSIVGNVITALPTNVLFGRAKSKIALGFSIYSSYLELGANYEFCYSRSSRNITYQPEHEVGGYLRLQVSRLEMQFDNSLKGKAYIDPFMNKKLNSIVLGSVSLQLKAIENFYLYAEIDNIYNSKYSKRYGYPEPGRTVIGGIRIII